MEFTEEDAGVVLEECNYQNTEKNRKILLEEGRRYLLVKALEEYAEERIYTEGDHE